MCPCACLSAQKLKNSSSEIARTRYKYVPSYPVQVIRAYISVTFDIDLRTWQLFSYFFSILVVAWLASGLWSIEHTVRSFIVTAGSLALSAKWPSIPYSYPAFNSRSLTAKSHCYYVLSGNVRTLMSLLFVSMVVDGFKRAGSPFCQTELS